MKVKKLSIKNFKLISNAEIVFEKPLICLYGDVEQGKTTFLNAVKLLFQKGFPDDLIQHGQKEASIELTLENGVISRSFYINKENEITARPLKAILNNKEMKISELQNLFNPFQLNQDFLKEMTALERKKFFVELFNVDTKEIDEQINKYKNSAEHLRIQINSYGDIDLTEVKEPNIIELQQKEKEIRVKYNEIALQIRVDNKALKDNWKAENQQKKEEIEKFNDKQKEISIKLEFEEKYYNQLHSFKDTIFKESINYIEAEKIFLKLERPSKLQTYTETPEPNYRPETDFDTSELTEIQEKISNAKADQIRYDNYLKAVQKNTEKIAKQTELKEIESSLRELRNQKNSKLAEYGKEIPRLKFTETGDCIFENSNIENLSTSQIVRLGELTSKLFPQNLIDLELIDRAESLNLNKNIGYWIERANKENRQYLMSIVGDKPADLLTEKGCFVTAYTVENGKLI